MQISLSGHILSLPAYLVGMSMLLGLAMLLLTLSFDFSLPKAVEVKKPANSKRNRSKHIDLIEEIILYPLAENGRTKNPGFRSTTI